MPEIRSWKLIPSPFKCSEYLVRYRDEVRACVCVRVCVIGVSGCLLCEALPHSMYGTPSHY